MRHILSSAALIVAIPALTACSFGPQKTEYGSHGASTYSQYGSNCANPCATQAHPGPVYAQLAFEPQPPQPAYNPQYAPIQSQGDMWCSNAGCAPHSTYSVSGRPVPEPSYYAPQRAKNSYGHKSPALRGAYSHGGFGRTGYKYANLGAVSYNTGNDMYGVQGRFGYQSNNYWGGEIEGSFGVDDDKINDPTNALVKTQNIDYSVAAFALARLPISRKLSAHARGGYHATELTTTIESAAITAESSQTLDGFAYGAGLEYAVSPVSAVRLDYTVYENDSDQDLDAVSLGYAHRF